MTLPRPGSASQPIEPASLRLAPLLQSKKGDHKRMEERARTRMCLSMGYPSLTPPSSKFSCVSGAGHAPQPSPASWGQDRGCSSWRKSRAASLVSKMRETSHVRLGSATLRDPEESG